MKGCVEQQRFIWIVFVFLILIGIANAEVIPVYDAGWYNDAANSQPTQINYMVGGILDLWVQRNWFVFDLSGVDMTVGSATLRAYNISTQEGFISDGYLSPDEFETWTLFDVVTDLTSLMNYTAGVSAYEDLGTGTLYGSTNVSMADNGKYVEVILNGNAITAINNSSSLFAIGGDITTMAPGYRQAIFACSHWKPQVELVLEEVPEPASLLLLGLGGLLIRKK